MSKVYRVALAGNPNCGKTTLFNLLTGTRQHVGNYPGVTVERKVGRFRLGDAEIELVDLPGVYSLSSSSPEERVAFQELMSDRIDLILNVVDTGNIQRNLYLTTQLVELGIPMMLAFNMFDDAERRGLQIDLPMFERYFGAPIVPTVGAAGQGMDRLRECLLRTLEAPPRPPVTPHYGEATDRVIEELAAEVVIRMPESKIPARYFAIKLLEQDGAVGAMPELRPLRDAVSAFQKQLDLRHGMSSETYMADRRYGMIAGACREAIRLSHERRRQISDLIDRFAVGRVLGVPIFLAVMYLVFLFTFRCAEPFMGVIEWFFGWLGETIRTVWPETELPFFRRLLTEGIIGGVGGVLVFLPNILLLFLAIAFLEGTGYMARAAFVMDGFMHKFGLHGKSFIPMLLGFGCTVPAIMATRTIESERDRLTTILVLPFMSCGARLPIYALFIPAFFPEKFQALILWIIYLLGVLVALGCAWLLKHTLFKGDGEVFVMELPPYRLPTLRSLFIHMWERTVMYLHKAGTLILLASIILFFINTFPEKQTFDTDYAAAAAALEAAPMDAAARRHAVSELEGRKKAELLEYSAAGRIGKGLSRIFAPLGFDWKVSSSLIGAFAAKELFVSQLGILYAIDEADEASVPLREQLARHYTPLQGFCIMVFCLLTIPCAATVAVVRRETNSWKLTVFQMAALITIAYLVTFLIYRFGLLFNLGASLAG